MGKEQETDSDSERQRLRNLAIDHLSWVRRMLTQLNIETPTITENSKFRNIDPEELLIDLGRTLDEKED